MAILDKYNRYLEHFGTTVPVRELHANTDTRGLCALRHDVDYDLDVALEMAYWEHEAGARATYFLLPTAPYWADERLADKCLQLQDYGHEIGLHVNAVAQWVGGEIDDPAGTLAEQLHTLREFGVPITGIAAHGDRRCYEHNVSNYWCFRELQPNDPVANEDGRTAEGPYEYDPDGRRLRYPENHEAVRPDGCRYPLWSIPMADLGIDYHAWHMDFDRYFSDSGGNWTRTDDPIAAAREDERWQVLIHPIHWRGPQRIYFFLSPARSGSKWLSEVLQQATPLEVRHEYILNQEYHHGDAAQKATATARTLEAEPGRVQKLLGLAWEEIHEIPRDYAEVNVYLPSFLNELQRYFPTARFVHLQRNPADVVRSLMQRDWYDTPEDHAHPRLHCPAIGAMTQFERVCEYVAEVDERLLNFCNYRMSLETLTSNSDALARDLRVAGIPYHKRLGHHLAGTVINASRNHDFPSESDWTNEQILQFSNRMARIDSRLGYSHAKPRSTTGWRHVLGVIHERVRRLMKGSAIEDPDAGRGPLEMIVDLTKVQGENCDVITNPDTLIVQPYDNDRHAYITIGGSRWHSVVVTRGAVSGWPMMEKTYVKGFIQKKSPQGVTVTVWALSYGRDGRQIYKRRLGTLDQLSDSLEFAFAPHPSGERFDIGVHISKSETVADIAISNIDLQYKIYGN